MRDTEGNGLNYESVQGNVNLRTQIARMSLLWGGTITGDDVVTTTGCMDALTLCLSAVTKPGDTIAVESPSYHGILQLAESFSLKVLELPTNPVYGIELDYLKKALKQHKIKALVLIPNFNNPLGGCMPDQNKEELVKLLEKENIPLIEDDIYGEMHFGKSRLEPARHMMKADWFCTAPRFQSRSLRVTAWAGRFRENSKTRFSSLNSITRFLPPRCLRQPSRTFLNTEGMSITCATCAKRCTRNACDMFSHQAVFPGRHAREPTAGRICAVAGTG